MAKLFLRTFLALLAITCGAVPAALAQPLTHRADVSGTLPLYFMRRPATDGSRRMVSGGALAPVTIKLASPPTMSDIGALRALGVVVETRRDGTPRGFGEYLVAELPAAAVDAVAALPRVTRIALDGAPFAPPRPLNETAAEVQATDLWRASTGEGAHLTGTGIAVCDIDSGIDPFHPLFFRADGGYVSWVDLDGDGKFSPDIDGVDMDGDGQATVLRALNSEVTNYYDPSPLFGSEDPAYAPGMDWLYADANGNSERDFGASAGFTEADPTYGERLFVADDVDGNGALDRGEKLVALGTSKVRALRYKKKTYRRGENLYKTPKNPDCAHGTGAAGVIVGGNIGLTRLVGIAPDADIVSASNVDGSADVTLTDFCIDEGARVVLHEYAPWLGYHLDGSSPLEKLIDTSVAEGIAHINPAGNLSTSQKLYKNTLKAGQVSVIPIEAPTKSPYGAFTFLGLSFLWRDPSRNLALELEDPNGVKRAVTSASPTEQINTEWTPGLTLYAFREDSDRGTARVDVYVFGAGAKPLSVPLGGWKLHVTDPAASTAPDLPVFGYVMDDLSGWGKGIHFPEDSSEDHLIGYPGTADHGLAVAAYTGHGWNGGEAGHRASYSGRGHRIDGESILWISAPDDPITSGYWTDRPATYMIFGGTSGASPHVAGAAALLLQADPSRDGDDVREAIKAGALVDTSVGAAPNDEYGNGKLRIYQSVFGEDPPGGTGPSIAIEPVKVALGEEAVVAVKVSDPEEASGSLVVTVDRDYDGLFEETLKAPELRVKAEELGVRTMKLCVTDATGRQAFALASVEVVPEVEKPAPPVAPAVGLVPGGGGGCAAGGGRAPGAWSLGALALAGMRLLRRRRFASIR